ncbi:MAG TPA: glycosyltransferase family 2 protein [Dongiaceae bacterium]|nr:glycosyltransferase family 2 protein [Dongiaceae bacterium]
MASIKTKVRRFRSALALEFRPFAGRMPAALHNRLSSEDGAARKAVIVGLESARLADHLGLRQAQRLVLPFPDFTPENLALLSESCDFVIASRMLHRCESPSDAGREILRVLRPGGWFACVSCPLDIATGGTFGFVHGSRRGLRALFPGVHSCSLGGAATPWILGRKDETSAGIAPSVARKSGRRRSYRFDPRSAKFGIMAMHRNEAPYLLEWIAYHRLLGFEQIVLYDNDSNDASARILAPLARAGVISVRRWRSRRRQQVKAHNDALERMRGHIEWCLYADVDEFLALDASRTLDDLVPREPDISGIGIPWRIYTAAGKRHRGTELTIERFTRAVTINDCHVKSLVRLRDISRMSVHIPKAFRGRLVDIGGTEIDPRTEGILPRPATGIARINHYFTRSWEEFQFKRARGRAQTPGVLRPESDFDLARKPDIEVLDMLRHVPAVRAEMERLRDIVGWKPSL